MIFAARQNGALAFLARKNEPTTHSGEGLSYAVATLRTLSWSKIKGGFNLSGGLQRILPVGLALLPIRLWTLLPILGFDGELAV